MIPDNVEKIIMTKEDYDRNVEQLLYDKINAEQEVERLNNIIKEAIKRSDELANEIEDLEGSYSYMFIEIINILKGDDK